MQAEGREGRKPKKRRQKSVGLFQNIIFSPHSVEVESDCSHKSTWPLYDVKLFNLKKWSSFFAIQTYKNKSVEKCFCPDIFFLKETFQLDGFFDFLHKS